MNKIIITEEQLRLVKESIDIQNVQLPGFIMNSIKQHKTSLGKHNVFPPEKEISFEEAILKKRYFELLTNVKKVDGINGDISKKTLVDRLEVLVVKCKEIEEPIKDKLEEICFEFVNDIFGIKYGDVNIECVLTDNIEIRQQVTPAALEDSFFEDTDHIENLTSEVMKRRLIDALVQGACVRLSSNYETILNKVYTLDQRLPEMYYNINAINEYLSFTTEKKPNNDNIGGIVSVDLSSDEPVIKSEAIIFTTLLYETIKGVMELLSAHGLPDDKTSAGYIIGQADFLLAENWDKRFGVGMWDILMDAIKHENMNILPSIFVELISIPADNFDKVMREVFAKTKKGKRIIEDLVSGISTDNKFNEIDNSLSIDNDEDYFTPEELISSINGIAETDTSSAGDYAYDVPAFLDAETANHSNMIANSVKDGLNEAKEYYDYWDIPYISETIQEFLSDKDKGVKVKKWNLIKSEQYRNALI